MEPKAFPTIKNKTDLVHEYPVLMGARAAVEKNIETYGIKAVVL
jgi:hypothetical protein